MTEIGEIKKGKEIGQKQGRQTFIWSPCIDCGKERWVQYVKRNPRQLRCISCGQINRASKSYKWKERRYKNIEGYIVIRLKSDDFFRSMADCQGYVLEHRLIMAQHFGRCLHRWEIVHHRNHKRDDNRIENLQLVSEDRHNQFTILETRIKQLEFKVMEQGKLIKLLNWQLRKEQSGLLSGK